MTRIAKKSGAYHHGDLRRVLLDAAVKVVDKDGIGALSLHALAKKAGVSSGAPYHHFGSREALLAAIAIEGYERLAAAMRQGSEEAAAESKTNSVEEETAAQIHLRGIGRGYVRFALEHRGYFRIMFRPELKEHLETPNVEAFSLLTSAIEACQKEGSIPSGDPRPLVLLAWASVHGASSLWIDGPLSTEGLVESEDQLGPVVADSLARLYRRR